MMSAFETLKLLAGYRAIAAGVAAAIAAALFYIKHVTSGALFLYDIIDGIISVLMIPSMMPIGWRVITLHFIVSAVWVAMFWIFAAHYYQSGQIF